jgi:hypothetical protein
VSKAAWWAGMVATILLAGWGFWHLRPAGGLAAGPPVLPAAVVTPSAPVVSPGAVRLSLDRRPPFKMVIKKISMWVLIEPLGLRSDGRIETPPYEKADKAFWYKSGSAPGQPGPAVILGHVDSKDHIAAFFYLSKIRPGYEIEVVRDDRSVAVFTVTSVEQFAKANFPTERVYGHTDDAVLRLVTCGGKYDKRTESYVDNIVVFATLSGFRRAASAR